MAEKENGNGNLWIARVIVAFMFTAILTLGMALWSVSESRDKELQADIAMLEQRKVERGEYEQAVKRLDENTKNIKDDLKEIKQMLKDIKK